MPNTKQTVSVSAEEFKKLNAQYATNEDISRVYGKAGSGKGEAAGYLAPSKLEAEMGRGPNVGSATDEAAQLVKMLKLGDYGEQTIPRLDLGKPGTWVENAAPVVGPALHKLDQIIQSVPDGAKKVSEWLRRQGIRTGQAGIRTYDGEN